MARWSTWRVSSPAHHSCSPTQCTGALALASVALSRERNSAHSMQCVRDLAANAHLCSPVCCWAARQGDRDGASKKRCGRRQQRRQRQRSLPRTTMGAHCLGEKLEGGSAAGALACSKIRRLQVRLLASCSLVSCKGGRPLRRAPFYDSNRARAESFARAITCKCAAAKASCNNYMILLSSAPPTATSRRYHHHLAEKNQAAKV